MTDLQTFTARMMDIQKKPGQVEADFSWLYEAFEGDAFDQQNHLAAAVENKVLYLTHELPGQISLGLSDLMLLGRFIVFREKYAPLNDPAPLKTISEEQPATKSIQEYFPGKSRQEINAIRSDWNRQRHNAGYQHTKEKLRLNKP